MQKLKNYFWLLLVILSCQGVLQAEDNQDYATQYIMQILAASGTKWRGNKEWIKDLKKGVSIETNFLFMSADTKEKRLLSTGAIVKAYDILHFIFGFENVYTIKAKFAITQENDGSVSIASSIKDTRFSSVNPCDTPQQAMDVEEDQKKDNYSECYRKIISRLNRETNKVEYTMASSCTTKIPLDLFIKEIEKNRNDLKEMEKNRGFNYN